MCTSESSEVDGVAISALTGTGNKASFARRAGAMLYDGLLLFGVLFVASIPLPLIDDGTRELPLIEWSIRIYLLVVAFLYFAWFWGHGGQTLGMRAWRLRLLARDGSRPRLKMVAIRFLASIASWLPLGGGYLWMLVDPRHEAAHDRISRTIIVHESG
jgi:uncharacterized RDD family membrane protein YckC